MGEDCYLPKGGGGRTGKGQEKVPHSPTPSSPGVAVPLVFPRTFVNPIS